MSATIVRMKKEGRALFWPWCAVMVFGALPVILLNSYTKKLNGLSFFLGVPLLAAFSLGREFHEGTLSLWLTQPASRMRLWGEKMSVMLAAALSATLVSGISMFYFTWPQIDFTWRVVAVVCVLMATASAPFWTVATRSTAGGFALIMSYLSLVFLLGARIDPFKDQPPPAALPAAAVTAICVFGLGYAILVFWLGARKLARFQVRGGGADDDPLLTDTELMPEVWAAWFRCRPNGAFLNLIRRELRLLRPFWLSMLLTLLYLAFAAMFRLMRVFPIPPEHPGVEVKFAVFATLGAAFLLLPVFAGVLSLGEERSSGTHAWHMALPVSPLGQWFVKLLTAMVAGFAGAVLLPLLVVIAVGSLLGSPFMYVDFIGLRDWMRLVPVMTFAAFWCACAAQGTVRASLCVTWAPMAIFAINAAGMQWGRQLAATTGTVSDLVVSRLQLSPLALVAITDSARGGVLWLFIPVLLLALIQSYRLFRIQPEEGARWLLRCLAPLAIVTLGWSLFVSAGFVSSRWEPFAETRHALDKLQPGTAKLELTGDDLAKNSAVTALTQRWLTGASITVAPDHSHSSGYLATIHLASGVECRMTVAYYGGTAASCKH